MTAVVSMLPMWYCAEYAKEGKVSYWQTFCALAEACGLKSVIDRSLELLSMLSLVNFIAYLRWGVGPPPALIALERVGPDELWAALALATLAIHLWAWVRSERVNRVTALAIAGIWWGTFSALIYFGGGFLAVHITEPWLAVLCMVSAIQMARVKEPDGTRH